MRRPVKPFVTEYKGSGRRGKDSRPEAEAEDGKPAEPKTAGKGHGEGHGKRQGKAPGSAGRGAEARGSLPPRGLFRGAEEAEPIDGYEAAMRAADALFSPKAKPGAEEADKRGGSAVPDAPGRGAAAVPAVAQEPTGRVLRALDEPEPVLPEPLPELAPKRRGRKLGSLNRPKPDIKASEGARRRVAAVAPAASPEPDEVLDVAAEEAPAPAAASRAPAVQAARPRDRFPWVRTKLRPGEKWKRRLPKVAW